MDNPNSKRPTKWTRHQVILFSFVSVSLSFFVVLILLELVFTFLPVNEGLRTQDLHKSTPYLHFEKNRISTYSKGWNFKLKTLNRSNNYGYINNHDYLRESKTPLLSIIGDSYIEALMVNHEETLQGRLQRRLNQKARVYSFAASGAPLSQYLNFAELATTKFQSNALIFVIISNDFDESLLRYKSAPGFYYFKENGKDLELVRKDYKASLFVKLVRHSRLARYLLVNLQIFNLVNRLFGENQEYVANVAANVDPKRLEDSKRAVDAFLKQLLQMNGVQKEKLLFLVDGIREEIYSEDSNPGSFFHKMRSYFLSRSKDHGIESIDLHEVFEEDYLQSKKRFEFSEDAHWNGYAHGVVSKAVENSRLYQSFLK